MRGSPVRNPYVHRGMIRDAEAFWGRQKELARLYAWLAGMQSVSIVGERRIGKSSILYCASIPQVQARVLGYSFGDYALAYVDLTRLTSLTPSAFLRFLMEELRRADENLGRMRLRRQVGPEEFQNFISAVNGKGVKPVFLLDEFDSVTRAEEFDLAFFDFLRSLANSNELAFVTASTRPLIELCHASVMSSPFFNIFGVIPLTVFERDEAVELIKVPSARVGYSLAEDADFLLELAGRHPFFLQIACFYAFDELLHSESVDYEAIRRRFRQEIRDHIDYSWRHLPSSEQVVWRHAAAAGPPFEPALLESGEIRSLVLEMEPRATRVAQRGDTPRQEGPCQYEGAHAKHYNFAGIRILIREAFTAPELRRFCQDRPSFRPILPYLSPNLGLEGMIDALIEYCQKRLLFPELLSEISELNPRQYKRHCPQLYSISEPDPDGLETHSASKNISSRDASRRRNLLLAVCAVAVVVALIIVAALLDPVEAVIALIFVVVPLAAGWVVNYLRRGTQ